MKRINLKKRCGFFLESRQTYYAINQPAQAFHKLNKMLGVSRIGPASLDAGFSFN